MFLILSFYEIVKIVAKLNIFSQIWPQNSIYLDFDLH